MAMNLSVLISGKDALSGVLRTVSGEMQMLKTNAEGGSVSGASLAGSLGKISTAAIAAVTAIAAAVAGITAFGKASLQTAQDFETMEAKMKTAVRSTALAKQMMAEAMEFAKKTPFDVKEVVDATVRLENYGLSAQKWLPLVGDMAGSMGRSMTDAVEAVADALNSGEFERMKEFGINQQTLRDFGWTGERTAQGMLSLRDAMKAVMEERFAGGMDNMMDTTAGKVSNLGDAFTRLKLTVGDMLKPTFEAIVEWATKLTEAIEDLIYKYYLFIYGPDAAEKFKAHADEARNARGRIRELDDEIKILNAGLDDTETAEEKAARKLEDLGEKAQQAAEDVADANASLEKVYADNAEKISDAENAVVKAQDDAAEATSRAAKRIADAQKDIEKAIEDKAERVEDANKRIADAERSLSETVENSAKRVRDAYENVIDAQRDLEKAERNTADTRIKLARELQETIEDAEEKIRDTKERTADQVERAEDRLKKAQERQWERNTPMSEQQRKMYEMQKDQREVEEAQQDVLKARQEQANAIAEATGEGAEKVAEKRQSIEEKLFSLAEREAELKERLSEATTAYNEALQKQADDIVKANERINEAVSNLTKVIEQADERIAEARERLKEAEENYAKAVSDGAERIAEAEKRLARAHEDAADRVASAIDRLNNAIQKMADADKALADYEKRQADKAEIERNIAARNDEKQKIQQQMQASEQQYQEAMKDPELGRGQKNWQNVKTKARQGYEIGSKVGLGMLGGAIGAGIANLQNTWNTMEESYNRSGDTAYGGNNLPGSLNGGRVRVDLAPGLQGKINDANARINTQINNTQAARNVTPAY